MVPIVIYDACVLYPAPLRDLLIRIAAAGIVRARWTDEILDECFRPNEQAPRQDCIAHRATIEGPSSTSNVHIATVRKTRTVRPEAIITWFTKANVLTLSQSNDPRASTRRPQLEYHRLPQEGFETGRIVSQMHQFQNGSQVLDHF